MKIVIVEDSADAAVMLHTLLVLDEHSVLLAFSGRSGIDLISVAQPDLAIVDLGLPDIDGFEVVRTAKKAPGIEKCVFVALTGRTDGNARQVAKSVGIANFFTKASDISHLLSFVTQHASCVVVD